MTTPGDQARTLAGRYELAQVIGRGGMGTVYGATDLVLDRSVAVKVLPAHEQGGALGRARFEREARAAAALPHPGIIAVFDAGEDDGLRFIVMERVRGRSLAAIVRDAAPLQAARAVALVGQVAGALAVAHRAGVVHRDIKPGNLMACEDGSIRILDFGIARITDATSITRTDSVLGSAAYMSPEQARGKVADARSDIYSLGCVLYALLAGRPPFGAGAVPALLQEHVNTTPAPLRELNPTVPPALEALVEKMLAKSPPARPQSAAAVRERLLEALNPASGTETAPTAILGAETGSGATLRAVARYRGRPRWIAAAALALGLVGSALALALGSGGESPSPRTDTGGGSRVSTSTGPARSPGRRASTSSSPRPAPLRRPPRYRREPGTSPPSQRGTPRTTPSHRKPKAPGHGGKPPGHGGIPPGQAKK